MGYAEFNIHVREMSNPLAKLVRKKNEWNLVNIYPNALYEQEMKSYRNNKSWMYQRVSGKWTRNIFFFFAIFSF